MGDNKTNNSYRFHLKAEDFLPADAKVEKERSLIPPSEGLWKDGFKSLRKKIVPMFALGVLVFFFIFAFILPNFYPYTYEQQIRGSEDLRPFQFSEEELVRIHAGEKVPSHPLGTDGLGRDMLIRVMIGTRISLLVGLVASSTMVIIGSSYGSIAGYFGGRVDMIMMRIVDVIYAIPDILIIILLQVVLKEPLNKLFETNHFMSKIGLIGPGLISIFIAFSLLYWVGMARVVRGQVMTIKEQEYVIAAKALGASSKRIIIKHLLPNCIGTIIVTATLQMPSAIFTESFLSFLGLGVSAPMPSLGSLASEAISGITSYSYRLIAPVAVISIVILAFNLFGDGLRDVFDPKLEK